MSLSIFLLSATILLSPLYIIRFHLLVPDFNFIYPTTLLEIMLLLSVVATSLEFGRDKFPFKKLSTRFDGLILLLLLITAYETYISYDFYGGLGIFKAYFIEPVLFYYCLIYQIRKKGSFIFIHSLIGLSLLLSLLAFAQELTGRFSLAPYELSQGRVSALYNSANSLALFIGPLSILSLAYFLKSKKNIPKLIYFAIFLSNILTIIFTKSRGGIIAEAFSLGIFIYVYLSLKIKILKKIWYVLPVSLSIIVCLFLYQLYLTYNFLPTTYGAPYTQGDTLQIRYFTWAGTINMLRDHLIFGAGLNGFKTLYTNQYRLPQYQEEFQYPHNLILTFWTETGIFGLFAFLLLLTSTFSLIIRSISHNKNPLLGAGFIAILSYWLIHGVVDVPYFKNDLSLEFWVMIALIETWALAA